MTEISLIGFLKLYICQVGLVAIRIQNHKRNNVAILPIQDAETKLHGLKGVKWTLDSLVFGALFQLKCKSH